MIQLAWRFPMFQQESALAQWYRARSADARGASRKTMIVAPCLRRGKLWRASCSSPPAFAGAGSLAAGDHRRGPDKLQVIAELDLEELQAIDPPLGYGRD
jgi:hypothetical protein